MMFGGLQDRTGSEGGVSFLFQVRVDRQRMLAKWRQSVGLQLSFAESFVPKGYHTTYVETHVTV